MSGMNGMIGDLGSLAGEITQRLMYETSDGRVHKTHRDALNHENRLKMIDWLNSPTMDLYLPNINLGRFVDQLLLHKQELVDFLTTDHCTGGKDASNQFEILKAFKAVNQPIEAKELD